eukprot:gene8172-9015_t
MTETAVNDDHHSARLIQKVFGHSDLYAILEVDRTASSVAIKKAYIRAALKHHPDKGGEKETFQALCLAHAILGDEERRKVYDEQGLVNDCFDDDNDNVSGGGGEGNEKSFAYWYDYFRKLTPAVTIESIDNLQMSYVGSEEERNDIITAYQTQNGDLFKVMDCILFAEKGTERHIIEIIDDVIEEGLIKSTKKYRLTKAKALETVDKNERKNNNNKKKKNVKAKGVEEEEEEEEKAQDLALLIRNRQKSRAAALGSILAKYGGDAAIEEEEAEEDNENDDDKEEEEARATTSRSSKRRRPNPKKK